MSSLPRPLTAPQISHIEAQRRALMAERAQEALAEQVDHQVLELMRRHGGSFVSCLAAAWLRADMVNSAKLAMAFGDLYREYAEQYAAGPRT